MAESTGFFDGLRSLFSGRPTRGTRMDFPAGSVGLRATPNPPPKAVPQYDNIGYDQTMFEPDEPAPQTARAQPVGGSTAAAATPAPAPAQMKPSVKQMPGAGQTTSLAPNISKASVQNTVATSPVFNPPQRPSVRQFEYLGDRGHGYMAPTGADRPAFIGGSGVRNQVSSGGMWAQSTSPAGVMSAETNQQRAARQDAEARKLAEAKAFNDRMNANIATQEADIKARDLAAAQQTKLNGVRQQSMAVVPNSTPNTYQPHEGRPAMDPHMLEIREKAAQKGLVPHMGEMAGLREMPDIEMLRQPQIRAHKG